VELERIRSGDSEALGLLLRETWAPLVRYLLTFLDSVEAAEDAAQEAFVRLWETEVRRVWLRRFDRGSTISPPTPEEELTGSELMQRFQEALESLPPKRREVFELVRLRGLSHREAAQVLEVSARTVANHLVLAMKDMRDMLSDFPAQSPAEDDHGREERANDG